MIVCVCEGVNDRLLQDLMDGGASTLAELGHHCGAGTDCGRCRGELARRLAQRRRLHHPHVRRSAAGSAAA